MNTPEHIDTRGEGATFYCADCRKTYQQCKCVVYRSADTIRHGKSGMPWRSVGYSRPCPDGIPGCGVLHL